VKGSPSMRSRAQAGTSREKCLKLLSGDEAAARRSQPRCRPALADNLRRTRGARSHAAPRGNSPTTIPLAISVASSGCLRAIRRLRSLKKGATALSIAFRAASEGSTYSVTLGPASNGGDGAGPRFHAASSRSSSSNPMPRAALSLAFLASSRQVFSLPGKQHDVCL